MEVKKRIEMDVDGDVLVSYENFTHNVTINVQTPAQLSKIVLPMSALRQVFEFCEAEEKKVLEVKRAEKQKKCKHRWNRVERLFFALGDYAPGCVCQKCGKQMKVT